MTGESVLSRQIARNNSANYKILNKQNPLSSVISLTDKFVIKLGMKVWRGSRVLAPLVSELQY
jgi:hypothetical protein